MITLKPLHDRVLIKPIDPQAITSTGIIIPDSAKEKPCEAVVVAVGTGTILEDGRFRQIDVREGDKILYNKHAGIEVKMGKDKLLLIREIDILATIIDRR